MAYRCSAAGQLDAPRQQRLVVIGRLGARQGGEQCAQRRVAIDAVVHLLACSNRVVPRLGMAGLATHVSSEAQTITHRSCWLDLEPYITDAGRRADEQTALSWLLA